MADENQSTFTYISKVDADRFDAKYAADLAKEVILRHGVTKSGLIAGARNAGVTMADNARNISVTLTADTSDYIKAIKEAKAATQQLIDLKKQLKDGDERDA